MNEGWGNKNGKTLPTKEGGRELKTNVKTAFPLTALNLINIVLDSP